MPITPGKDYVFAPKANLVSQGIVTAACLGTKNYLFFIPKNKMQGRGRTITTTTYSMGEHEAVEGLQIMLNDPEMTVSEVENKLLGLMNEWELDPKSFAVHVPELIEFQIKTGFLSRGIYYKYSGQKLRTGVSISGKENLINFKNFYGK